MGVLQDAVNLIGKVTYQFGGTDIRAGGSGDCSAFTYTLFNKYGYDIGRSTDLQVKQGTEVRREALLPGDLVFFYGTWREGVSHVGIYTGGGKYIHLGGTAGNVTVSKLADADNYLTARRIVPTNDPKHSEIIGMAVVPNAGETTGGTLSGGSDYDRSPAATVGNAFTEWSLDMIGEIVVIVLMIAAILLGIFFIFKAITAQIDIPSIDDLGDAVNNLGGAE